MTWYDQAACKSEPQSTFFPEGQTGLAHDWSKAKAVCSTCPVLRECRDDVMAYEGTVGKQGRQMRYGFVAGLTADQRYQLDQRKGRELSAFEAMREPRPNPSSRTVDTTPVDRRVALRRLSGAQRTREYRQRRSEAS